MQENELQARLVAQQQLLPTAQVQQLFPAFQRSQTSSSDPQRDFLAFLVASKLVEPRAAQALRERLAQHRDEAASPARSSEAHTKPLNVAPPRTLLDASATSPARVSGSSRLVRPASRELLGSSTNTSAARQIGPYDVIRELGRGGMGVVYEARHRTLDRHVALKMLRERDVFKLESIERFKIEARAMAKLEHPNIIRIYEIGEDPEGVYMAMAFAKGGSLSAHMRKGRLDFKESADLVRQIALGLAHAHDRNIIHRDLKPDNILLSEEGTPRITDFGLAKALDHDSVKLSRTGQVMGTLAYMAPEQLDGKSKNHDRRSDIYALGVTFYEMLTGRLPHLGDGQLDLARKIMFDPPERPTTLCRQLPLSLETIALRALVKEPNGRYQSAGELAEDLKRWLNNERIAARPIGTRERFRRWRRRHGRRALLRAALVFAGLTVGVLTGALLSSDESSQALRQRVAELELAETTAEQARAALEAEAKSARGSLAEAQAEIEALKERGDRAYLALNQRRYGPDSSDPLTAHALIFEGHAARGDGIKKHEYLRCRFRRVDWRGVDLRGVIFKDCVLESGVVAETDLSGLALGGLKILPAVVFEDCRYDEKTAWPRGFEAEARSGLSSAGLRPRPSPSPKPPPQPKPPPKTSPPKPKPKPAKAEPAASPEVMALRREFTALLKADLESLSAADKRGQDDQVRSGLRALLPKLIAFFERHKEQASEDVLRFDSPRSQVLGRLLTKHLDDPGLLIASYQLAGSTLAWGNKPFFAAVQLRVNEAFRDAIDAALDGRATEAYRFVEASSVLTNGGDWHDLAFLTFDELGLWSKSRQYAQPKPPEPLKEMSEGGARLVRRLRAQAAKRRAAQAAVLGDLNKLRRALGPKMVGAQQAAAAVFNRGLNEVARIEGLGLDEVQTIREQWMACLAGVGQASLGGLSLGRFPLPFKGFATLETRAALKKMGRENKWTEEEEEHMLQAVNFADPLSVAAYDFRLRRLSKKTNGTAAFLRGAFSLVLVASRINGRFFDRKSYAELRKTLRGSELTRGLITVEDSFTQGLRRLKKTAASGDSRAARRFVSTIIAGSWALAPEEGRRYLASRFKGKVPLTIDLSCASRCRVTLTLGRERIVLEGGSDGATTRRRFDSALGEMELEVEALPGRRSARVENAFFSGTRAFPGVRLLLSLPDGSVLIPDPDRFQTSGSLKVVATHYRQPGARMFSRSPSLWVQTEPLFFVRSWKARLDVNLADFQQYMETDSYLKGVGFWRDADTTEKYTRFMRTFLNRGQLILRKRRR